MRAQAQDNRRFRFQPEGHHYLLDDVEIPGVSQVVLASGLYRGSDWWTKEARDFGQALHFTLQLEDENDLDESTVPDELRQHLEAYRIWKLQVDFVPELVECPLYHPTARYGGTPDRTGTMRGTNGRVRAVVDFKSGADNPGYRYQTAAYANLMPEPYGYERICLRLRRDADFRVIVHPRSSFASDLSIFLSALNVFNARRSNRTLKTFERD